MAIGVIFTLLQIAAGLVTFKLSEKMSYFVTPKMNQLYGAQSGQVQVVCTSGQPMIVSSGQPTVVSSHALRT